MNIKAVEPFNLSAGPCVFRIIYFKMIFDNSTVYKILINIGNQRAASKEVNAYTKN